MRFFTVDDRAGAATTGGSPGRRGTRPACPAADFATQTGQLLDRLAAAIRDSAEATDPVNSGTDACGPPGQDTLCLVDIPGASHNAAWQSFRTWTQPLLAIAPATQSVTAGTPSVRLDRLADHDRRDRRSRAGLRSPSRSARARRAARSRRAPPGRGRRRSRSRWRPGVPGTFYYRDTRAGVSTVTASATGATAGTQTVTVTAGSAARVTIESGPIGVPARATRPFTATRPMTPSGTP